MSRRFLLTVQVAGVAGSRMVRVDPDDLGLAMEDIAYDAPACPTHALRVSEGPPFGRTVASADVASRSHERFHHQQQSAGLRLLVGAQAARARAQHAVARAVAQLPASQRTPQMATLSWETHGIASRLQSGLVTASTG